jgi:microcin C transport system substrate-binding protein
MFIALSRLGWVLALCCLAATAMGTENSQPRRGVAMHGAPKYAEDFKHFDYVNPSAPKGGALRQASIGSFNSLNPFIVKGESAEGLGLLFDSLMAQSADEPFSLYGLVAETITMPEDRSWVAFSLRKEAHFHDGSPITPEDVLFSLEILRTKGQPEYSLLYQDVVKAEKVGERELKFTFKNDQNRELPLILAQMSILSKAYYAKHDFEQSTLEAPLGSGPYQVDSVDPGRAISYKRAKNYWAANLPVNVGRYNFDTLRYDYYRDPTVALEALKAGSYDVREENVSKQWAMAYTGPVIEKKWLLKEEIPHQQPQGLQGYVFNTRKPIFKDRRVRHALMYLLDFEWMNKSLFHGAYTRSNSYFSNSPLASSGLPSQEELALLTPLKDQLPAEIFTQIYELPVTDGSGDVRKNLRKAFALFKDAGWEIKNGAMTHVKTGEAFKFEILAYDEANARFANNFKQNAEKMGLAVNVRVVDVPQYIERVEAFDYDFVTHRYGQSMSPGNEQRAYWGAAMADARGGRNYAGIKDPAIDQLVEKIIAAKDWSELVIASKALDRALLWGFYMIPQWHITYHRVAYWDKFGRPAKLAPYALGLADTWWEDVEKRDKLTAARNQK